MYKPSHIPNMREYLVSGLGHLSYKHRCLLLYDKITRLRGDLITLFQYLMGSYKKRWISLLTRTHMEKTWGNGYQFLLRKF